MRIYIRLLAVLVFSGLFTLTAMGMVDDSLVLYLTFDEGSGDEITDHSVHGNHGTIKGSPKWVDGKSGAALEFDGGGDSVEIASSDSLNITSSLTMEMWVSVPVGGEVKQAGIEKGGWEVGEYSLYPVYEGGTVVQFFDLPPACGDAVSGAEHRGLQARVAESQRGPRIRG